MKNRHAAALGKKGGKAGRGAAKARTSEQARAAAQARWAKRQPKSEMPNASDEPRPLGAVGSGRLLDSEPKDSRK